MTHGTPNRLIHESSPYLLQHAYNPVDWYPWGPEALERARAEDKPILLSIGYSACHWCHVMERESFEDAQTAALMNEHFVSVKVDREERPDLDSIYMEAVQAMAGQGGWPMTVFLTPQGLPFYGGTYFPPVDRHGLPGFRRVLASLAETYTLRRDEVAQSAQGLRGHLGRGVGAAGAAPLGAELLDSAYAALSRTFDHRYGGLSGAPKFPQPANWEFLLRTYRRTGDAGAWAMAESTLRHMANGGMYDQLGGGFHRYSVDERWLTPHFEKMLYDNAQLACLYLHAYQVSGDAYYRRIVEQTLDYLAREMTAPEGGFYSSQDADSEGHEGKFFLWTPQQIRETLTAAGMAEADQTLLMRYYDVTPQGNFEGSTILNVPRDATMVAQAGGVDVDHLTAVVETGRGALYQARERRIKPARDEKVLTSWNGLALRAFAEAGATLGRADYLNIAERNARFMLSTMVQSDGRLLHAYKDGQARLNGYLEDYAFLADGLLALYEATFDLAYYTAARALLERVVTRFQDPAEAGFFSTSDDHEALFRRPKDLMDNAAPAGNSVAVECLLRLAAYTGQERYSAPAEAVLAALARPMAEYPGAFTRLLGALDFMLAPPTEVALVGSADDPGMAALLEVLRKNYRPTTVVAWSGGLDDVAVGEIPLLEGRTMREAAATAYVCRRFSCQAPVTTAVQLREQLAAGG